MAIASSRCCPSVFKFVGFSLLFLLGRSQLVLGARATTWFDLNLATLALVHPSQISLIFLNFDMSFSAFELHTYFYLRFFSSSFCLYIPLFL